MRQIKAVTFNFAAWAAERESAVRFGLYPYEPEDAHLPGTRGRVHDLGRTLGEVTGGTLHYTDGYDRELPPEVVKEWLASPGIALSPVARQREFVLDITVVGASGKPETFSFMISELKEKPVRDDVRKHMAQWLIRGKALNSWRTFGRDGSLPPVSLAEWLEGTTLFPKG